MPSQQFIFYFSLYHHIYFAFKLFRILSIIKSCRVSNFSCHSILSGSKLVHYHSLFEVPFVEVFCKIATILHFFMLEEQLFFFLHMYVKIHLLHVHLLEKDQIVQILNQIIAFGQFLRKAVLTRSFC